MPCTIVIQDVRGVVPAGQNEITILRVVGDAPGCPQVEVRSMTLGIGWTTVSVANSQFHADLPITVTPKPQCSDVIDVTVRCTNGECQQVLSSVLLGCCYVTIASVDGVTPGHALQPTAIAVGGEAFGCARVGAPPKATVTVTATTTAGILIGTSSADVDDITGRFSATVPINPANPVECGQPIDVAASCTSGTPCASGAETVTVGCHDCYRVHATVDTSAPCTGPAGAQTKDVEILAEIGLPTGPASRDFFWDFGGGIVGPTFTATVTSASDTHKERQTITLAPGTYTATLRFATGAPENCVEYTITFTVVCDGGNCPTVDPPSVSPQCDAMGRRTVTFVAKPPPSPHALVIAQWDYTGLGNNGPAFTMPANSTTNVSQTVSLAPGTYTAKLTTLLPSPPACPDRLVQFTVPPCPPPGCNLDITNVDVTVSPTCEPDGTRKVTVQVTLNSTDPNDRFFVQWDPMIPAVGLPADPNGFVHFYPAPGTGVTQRTITVTVVRSPDCADTWTQPIIVDLPGCGTPCPQITALQIDPNGVCSPDGLHRTVTLDATTTGAGITGFGWDFGDGHSQMLSGAAGPHTTHDFAPGTYIVNLHAIGPGNCNANLSQQITVPPCCPQLTGIAVSQAPCFTGTPTVAVTLTAELTGHASSFDWSFGDGTTVTTTGPQAPAHDYAPNTYTVSVTANEPGCPSVTSSKSITVDPCSDRPPPSNTQIDICAALLWIAIVMSIIGVALLVAGCIVANFNAYAGLVIELIGGSFLLTALMLFIFWWIFCRWISPCKFLIFVYNFLVWMMVAIAIGTAIAAFLTWIFGGISYAQCFLWSLLGFAYWSTVAGMLWWLINDRKCLIENPAADASSSSNPLTSSDVAQIRPSAAEEVARPAGLGDVLKKATSAVGIKPCSGCHQRAEKLNRAFPFRGSSGPANPATEPIPLD